MLYAGTRIYAEGMPDPTVNAVWKKSTECSDTIQTPYTFSGCYQPNAEITNANFKGRWYGKEDTVKAACSEDEKCLGYWKRSSGPLGMLYAGTRTYAEGMPDPTVNAVWKKSTECSDTIHTPYTFSGCYLPDAEVTNANFNGKWYFKEDTVKAACSEDEKCLGYWKRSGGQLGMLHAGTRTYAEGKPNPTVKGVWKKSTGCQIGNFCFNINDS